MNIIVMKICEVESHNWKQNHNEMFFFLRQNINSYLIFLKIRHIF